MIDVYRLAELVRLDTRPAPNARASSPGAGKTFLAHALGHIACRRGYSVLALGADRMLKTLRHARLTQTHEKELRALLAVTSPYSWWDGKAGCFGGLFTMRAWAALQPRARRPLNSSRTSLPIRARESPELFVLPSVVASSTVQVRGPQRPEHPDHSRENAR